MYALFLHIIIVVVTVLIIQLCVGVCVGVVGVEDKLKVTSVGEHKSPEEPFPLAQVLKVKVMFRYVLKGDCHLAC